MKDTLIDIGAIISKAKKIVVVTGAGISVSGGIPVFFDNLGL
jgi:NAD-dependent SIR2 family protein deacetylase